MNFYYFTISPPPPSLGRARNVVIINYPQSDKSTEDLYIYRKLKKYHDGNLGISFELHDQKKDEFINSANRMLFFAQLSFATLTIHGDGNERQLCVGDCI